MKSLWIYMVVFLVSVKCVASQCIGSTTCDCHCACCSTVCWGSRYCTSCAKGWSGTTNNGCQRQNIAYRSSVKSTSIYEFKGYQYVPENAVDGDNTSSLRTKSEPYSHLTLTLSGFFNIKYIYVYMYTEAYKYYKVFVTNSDLPALTSDTECASFSEDTNQYTKGVITCKRVLNGNQVVIGIENNYLQLYEIDVYQCSQGTYGIQCDSVCRNCVDNRCDGYTGACESGCNIGWQGTTCETKCNKNCVDNKCDQNTGICTVGCKPDWFGDKCDIQCPSLCESHCDRYLGCTNCQIGYNGPNCDQCYANMYGKNCSLTCQNCDDCNNVNGCGECQNGYYGDFCNIECPKRCRNYICSRQSGDCVYGCKDGYAGTKCETSCKDNCTTCSTVQLTSIPTPTV